MARRPDSQEFAAGYSSRPSTGFPRSAPTARRSRAGDAYPGLKPPGTIPDFKHGGTVKKTGLAKVHKGERVLTAKGAKSKGKKK